MGKITQPAEFPHIIACTKGVAVLLEDKPLFIEGEDCLEKAKAILSTSNLVSATCKHLIKKDEASGTLSVRWGTNVKLFLDTRPKLLIRAFYAMKSGSPTITKGVSRGTVKKHEPSEESEYLIHYYKKHNAFTAFKKVGGRLVRKWFSERSHGSIEAAKSAAILWQKG